MKKPTMDDILEGIQDDPRCLHTRELVAAMEHDRWARWMEWQYEHDTPENHRRWVRQMNTPYDELSEAEKDSDRKEANDTLLGCMVAMWEAEQC